MTEIPWRTTERETEKSVRRRLTEVLCKARIRPGLINAENGSILLLRAGEFLAQGGPVFTVEAWAALQNLTALKNALFVPLYEAAAPDECEEILLASRRIDSGMSRLRRLWRRTESASLPWTEETLAALNDAAGPFIFFLAFWLQVPVSSLHCTQFITMNDYL